MLTRHDALRAFVRAALLALFRGVFLGILLLVLPPAYLAHAEWPVDWLFLQSERGWFFYHESREPIPRPLPQPDETPPKAEPPNWLAPPPPESPEDTPQSTPPTEGPALQAWLAGLPDTDLERLVTVAPASAIRAWIPILMDQALTRLDRVSVRKYLLVQQESLRRSETFSHIWQEVIWTDPSFDRPGSLSLGTIAQNVYDEEQHAREQQDLVTLRDSVSLLLAVEPNCRPCEIQWKILKAWADQYQFTVRPIAATLVTLADSTAVLPYPQIIDALQITEFPSLYLIQPSSRSLTRLGTGILTEQEIATRLLRLIPQANPEGALTHVSTLSSDAPPVPSPAPAP